MLQAVGYRFRVGITGEADAADRLHQGTNLPSPGKRRSSQSADSFSTHRGVKSIWSPYGRRRGPMPEREIVRHTTRCFATAGLAFGVAFAQYKIPSSYLP